MSTREMDPVFTAALRELLITTLKDAPRERTRAIDGLKEHEDRLRPSRRGLVASFAILALAAAIVVPLTVGGSTGRPHVEKGAVLRLASYAFRLPSGYRQTKAATHCYVVFGSPGGAPGNEPPTSSQPLPPYQSGIEAAVSASGGCVVMQLAPPYIPTRAHPDPEAKAYDLHPVRVASYRGLIVTGHQICRLANGSPCPEETLLYVEIPVSRGRVQDLAVGARGLSQSTLIRIMAKGLAS